MPRSLAFFLYLIVSQSKNIATKSDAAPMAIPIMSTDLKPPELEDVFSLGGFEVG